MEKRLFYWDPQGVQGKYCGLHATKVKTKANSPSLSFKANTVKEETALEDKCKVIAMLSKIGVH